jgi:hypothetical protein
LNTINKNNIKILNAPLFSFENTDWRVISILFKLCNIKLTGGNNKFKHKLASNQFYLMKNLELIYKPFEVESLIIHNMKNISFNSPYLNKYLYYLNKIINNDFKVNKYVQFLKEFKNYFDNFDILYHKNYQIQLIDKFQKENYSNLIKIFFIIEILIEINMFKNEYANLNIYDYFIKNKLNYKTEFDGLNKLKMKYKNIQFSYNLYIFIKENFNIKYLVYFKNELCKKI